MDTQIINILGYVLLLSMVQHYFLLQLFGCYFQSDTSSTCLNSSKTPHARAIYLFIYLFYLQYGCYCVYFLLLLPIILAASISTATCRARGLRFHCKTIKYCCCCCCNKFLILHLISVCTLTSLCILLDFIFLFSNKPHVLQYLYPWDPTSTMASKGEKPIRNMVKK